MFEPRACEECGEELVVERQQRRTRKRFCSPKCRYRNRDRQRYAADPESARAKSRRYYEANRARVIARVVARQRVQRNEEVERKPLHSEELREKRRRKDAHRLARKREKG